MIWFLCFDFTGAYSLRQLQELSEETLNFTAVLGLKDPCGLNTFFYRMIWLHFYFGQGVEWAGLNKNGPHKFT